MYRRRANRSEGFTVVIVLIIASVIIMTIAAVMPQAYRSNLMAKKHADSMRAFYAAESAANLAFMDYNDDEIFNTVAEGTWNAVTVGTETFAYYQVSAIDTTDPSNPLVTVTGSSPGTAANDAKRYITLSLTPSITPNPGSVTNAIEAGGDVDVGGSAEVNGEIEEDSDFTFEDIFGVSKEYMKANLATVITDPGNNYTPVSGITWFDLEDKSDVKMTSMQWEGSGIMVVEGDLKLTGGTFNGIIYVTGDLDVAGNVNIAGAIFVEGDANIGLTGNPTITYDSGVVGSVLSGLSQEASSYWKEIYPSEAP